MREVLELVRATTVSRSFAEFFSGVDFDLPKIGRGSLKIKSVRHFQRSAGYRLVRHSVSSIVKTDTGLVGYGYGESDHKLLALQKSIAEGVERCIFRVANKLDPTILSTNGWATHTTKAKARQSAASELLERDAALVHWLSETPLLEVSADSWPKVLQTWAAEELSRAPRFNRLRVLVSQLGHISIVATVIADSSGLAFVSQAASHSLESAISKSLAETCRIADIASKATTPSQELQKTEISTPEDHIDYYAARSPLPEWLFGRKISYKVASSNWKSFSISKSHSEKLLFDDYQCGPLHVAHAFSNNLQNLFFGTTDDAVAKGWINFKRLEKFCGSRGISPLPHFVP